MLTDAELRDLDDASYRIDPKYGKWSVTDKESSLKSNEKNTILAGKRKFKVLKTKYDKDNTGYKGMAVAPITKEFPNGDPTQVVVISAGTNIKKVNETLGAFEGKFSKNGSDQSSAARKFVKEVQKKYYVTQLSGHSQGAYMLKVGANLKIPTTVFNGWFKYGTLSETEKNFMAKHPEMFINYRRKDDWVVKLNDGNVPSKYGKSYGTIVWAEGKDHDLSAWKVDKSGKLTEVALPASQKVAYVIEEAKSRLKAVAFLRKKLTKSGGKLSAAEQIYLDSEQASIVADGAYTTLVARLDELIEGLKKESQKFDTLWQQCLVTNRGLAPNLSDAEILSLMNERGATEKNIATDPKEQLESLEKTISSGKKEFKVLVDQIQAGIAKQLEADTALANQLRE